MEHLLTQFQDNLQAIQNDLIENFTKMNGSISTLDGLKLDYWNGEAYFFSFKRFFIDGEYMYILCTRSIYKGTKII